MTVEIDLWRGWPASGVAESSHLATPSAGRGFVSDVATQGAKPGASDVWSVDRPLEEEPRSPMGYGWRPANRPHERRISDFTNDRCPGPR